MEKEPAVFIMLQAETLKTILDLAEIGDVDEVLNQLDKLVQSDKIFMPLQKDSRNCQRN